MKFLFRLFLGFLALFGAFSPETVSADKTNVTITGASVGFRGCYKDGYLTPATVRFTAEGGEGETVRVVLESIDPDGTPTYWETVVPLSDAEGERCVETFFMSGRENAPLTIRLISSGTGEILAESVLKPEGLPLPLRRDESDSDDGAFLFPKPIDARQPIWLVVGGKTDAMAAMLNSLQLSAERTPILVALGALDELPGRRDGLESVDLVILNASDRTAFTGAGKGDSVLKEWLALGGKTVLFGSAESLDLLAPGGVLADFVPGEVDSEHPSQLRAAPSLVRFVPKAKNLVMLGSLDSPYLTFPRLTAAASDARIDLNEEEKILLARRPVGFGMSLFFAADPNVSPLADWNGRNGLLMKIFASEVERLTAQAGQTGLMRLGYRDLAGQLRSALDRFDGIRPFSFSLVFTFMILFVAAIGPIDWFVTHRILSRPNLTWMTFPVWLVLFSLLAVWLGGGSRLKQYRMNVAEIADFDAETGGLRDTLWGVIYAPEDARLDVTAVPAGDPDDSQTELAWFGLAGTGLGGISSPIRGYAPMTDGYTFDGAVLCRFPVPIRSTRSIRGSRSGKGTPTASRLTDEEGRLSGKLSNPFDVPMKDAMLLYAGHAWFLGTLPPGDSDFDPSAPKTDAVQRTLTGANNPFELRGVDTQNAPVRERYSDMATDPAAILRVAAFYRLAGGRAALGLGNEGMAGLDASDALDAGRAVLLAEIESEPTSFAVASESGKTAPVGRRSILARVWVPVDRIGREDRP